MRQTVVPVFRFSDTQIKKIPFSASTDKQDKYKDQDQKGLYLVVSKSRKVFRLVVHVKTTRKTINLQIGPFPDLKTEEARYQCNEILGKIAKGWDPSVKIKEEKEEENKKEKSKAETMTLREARDNYVSEKILYKKMKESTAKTKYFYDFDMYGKDLLDLPLSQITQDKLEEHIKKEAELPGKNGRGRLTSLGIFIRGLSAVLDFSKLKYATPEYPLFKEGNPITRIKKMNITPKNSRSRVLSTKELPVFFDFIYKKSVFCLGSDSMTTADYLLFLLFSGARRREASLLKWKDVSDLGTEEVSVTFLSTKTHVNRKIPVGPFISRLLSSLKAKNPESEYVFPGEGKSGHIEEPKNLINSFLKMTKMPSFSVHDLRRTYITHNRPEVSDILILKVLVGHATKTNTTDRHYSIIREEVSSVLRDTMIQIEESLLRKCQPVKIV